MLPIHIGKSDQDLGICLKVLCPHCQHESEFRLRLRSVALRLFGHAIGNFGESYEVMCSLCKFREDLGDGELPATQAAVRLYAQLTAHEISPNDYAKTIDALDFATIRKLRDEAAIWSCPVCKEKVPATLNGCWKCGSPRPGLLNSDLPERDDLPRLPYPVTRPSNPWEE